MYSLWALGKEAVTTVSQLGDNQWEQALQTSLIVFDRVNAFFFDLNCLYMLHYLLMSWFNLVILLTNMLSMHTHAHELLLYWKLKENRSDRKQGSPREEHLESIFAIMHWAVSCNLKDS